MENLSLIIVAAGFLALGLSGCSSCMPSGEEKKAETLPPRVTCGPGTVISGTQCVGAVKPR